MVLGAACILFVCDKNVELRRDERRNRGTQKLMRKELQTPEITKPLLTIAIPTYNRAGCLKELLSVLADQLKDEPRVELIISDNASPDETPFVVQDFVSRGLRVRYIRNTQNIGADANFLQCFEQALGKYVWLFSDDDLIVPGGLAKILTYCGAARSEEHTSELQSLRHLVCRLLLEKKKKIQRCPQPLTRPMRCIYSCVTCT